jgi:hypothetical protein
LDENGFFERVERYKQVAQEQRDEARAAKGEPVEKKKKKKTKAKEEKSTKTEENEVNEAFERANDIEQEQEEMLIPKKAKKKKRRNEVKLKHDDVTAPIASNKTHKRKRDSTGGELFLPESQYTEEKKMKLAPNSKQSTYFGNSSVNSTTEMRNIANNVEKRPVEKEKLKQQYNAKNRKTNSNY